MRRALRIGAGFCLALLIVTCTDKSVIGPRPRGSAAFDLRAFAAGPQPGMPDIPLDSIRVILRRLPGLDSAAGEVFRLQADTLAPDSLRVDLSVSLNSDPESFQVTVQAYGGNTVWYVASDTTVISTGAPATPRLLARYVGPGAGATSVTIAPRDTTVVGGQAVLLRVTVDSGTTALAGVPVGIRSGDTTKGTVGQPSFTSGIFTGRGGINDSLWLYVETPTHLRDSTRIHIVPPPSQLVKVSGDSQSVIVNGATAAPLAVRVEDALNGGSPGVPVTWTVTQGTATLAPPSPVTSDTGGYARVTVTPSSLGTVKVQASAVGLTGSPVTFTVTVLAGIVHQVIVAPKVDTIAKGATVQFTATLKDSLGNVITTVKPVWTSTNTAVATVDTTGLATALRRDSTYIVASAGGFADTARLYVRAPAKVVLTPSDTVVTAIGDSLHYTGVVLTNFGDTVKTGTVVRFFTTTPSVATVNAVTGEAHAVGAGIGVILAVDTVNSDSGTATLRVNQKVFRIVNNPPDTIKVGVNGQAQIRATAIDKNGNAIPGKTFGWLTRNPAIATVNQSGVVTGLTVGAGPTYAVDTLVDSLTVVRDSTVVSVLPSPPAVMRWAFDTLAIGNGGNTSVTVSLNVPSANGTTMQIVSSDTTRVKPTQSRIAIGVGGASASITLQGLAATLTPVDVVAQDSAGVYAPDTLRVLVVSTIYFTSTGQTVRTSDFYVNQNETLNGQVFLSDPAPAGGLGVTFVIGKGFSSVTPGTVIIPQGQLAAAVQFGGTGVGTDSVTPSSGAFAGKFSYVHVAKDSLLSGVPYPGTGVIGLGQWEQPGVSIPYAMDHILPFTVSVSPAVATPQSPDTIPVGYGSRAFIVTGTALGTGTVTISAPNWLSTSFPVIVSTPKLGASGTTSIVAGAPVSAAYWQALTEDTLSFAHPVSAPVHVTAVSRDTTIVKVVVDTLTVTLNNSSNSVSSSLLAQPGAGGDSTYLVISAPGYRPDSMLIHVTKPALTSGFGYPGSGYLALNTQFVNAGYVQIPYARPDSFWVLLSHSRRGVLGGPDSVVIPKGQNIGYFNVLGDSLGADSVTITRATGYVVSIAAPQYVFTVDSLHVRLSTYPTGLFTISPPQIVNVAAYDPFSGQYRNLITPVTATLALTRPNVVTLDSVTLTIPAGAAFSAYDTMRVAGGVAAPDSTRIVVTAPGSSPDTSQVIRVQPTPLQVSLSSGNVVGHGLRAPGNYVYLPSAAPNTLSVALGRTIAGKDSLVPLTVAILKGQSSSAPFEIWGFDSTAADTITAQATGFTTGKATVFLQRDTLRMARPSPSQITTAPPFRLYTYLYNVSGYNQKPWAPVTMTFTSSDPTIISIDSGQAVNGALDTVTALVDTTRAYGVVRINFTGPGTAYIKATAPGFGADSFPVTVTGPSLSFSYSSVTVGTQQFTTQYVNVQNAPAAPVTVTLQRSDSTAAPGSQVFAFSPTVLTIPAGFTQSNVDTLVGQNIGVAQLLARATGYGTATATIQVGQPKLQTTTQINPWVGATPYAVTAYTTDQSGALRQVNQATVLSVSITDPTVATVDSTARTVAYGNTSTTNFMFTALKKGTVQAIFSSPGYKSDTMLIKADTGTLATGAPASLGVGQTYQSSVSIPYQTANPVVVTLTSSNPAVFTVPSTVTIGAGQSSSPGFTITGVGTGAATLTASAPGVLHPSLPLGITVTSPQLVVAIGSTANAGQAEFFTVYAEDSVGGSHPVANPVTVHLSSSAGVHASFAADSITILAGNSSASSSVTFDTAGAFSVTASATGYGSGTSSPVTVAGVEIKVGVGNTLTFTPGTDTVAVNHYATWVWDSANTLQHGVHWLSGPGSLPSDSPQQASGSYQVYFTTAGTYTYQCIVHGASMPGTIVVQ